MKKTIAFFLAFFMAGALSLSFVAPPGHHLPDEHPGISVLVVNANVTVVLVGSNDAQLLVNDSKGRAKFVALSQRSDTLVIDALRGGRLTESTIVYVPASGLRKIHVNSGGAVRSLQSLQIPLLEVVVNGACRFAIRNIGTVNVLETDGYTVEQSTDVHPIPARTMTARSSWEHNR